ncbi:FAD-dependent oxidoreductase [Thermobifida halotolerans]|uniref:FAD-dependent oxidoreductase n=1 Tax=Thermobifida halotolerans TaxID=483545 RepID=A0A399G7U8_9ACTN|nr:FAD-dependent oxidoreductase [Thermobifida halotolerans]UOE20701.1 FAD-dependent oxidoreductase [Thermobifida halotolerans]
MEKSDTTQFPHLFTPVRVGRMDLPNRIMATPHATPIGNLWSADEAEADRNIAYWAARARAGLGWVGGISAALENHLVPGFEPTGVGATVHGVFRLPHFHDRVRKLSDTLHEAGARVTAQIIMQGGMPHGPSPAVTAYVANQVSHGLDRGEIAWFVDEYAESARRGQQAGLDGVELHANHDDLLEWFLSPASNHRDDAYGGDLAGRMRFITEIIDAVRAEVGPDFTLGVRMNLYQTLDGGYDAAGGVEIARALEATGKVDYLSLAVGDNWGAPSYIQPHHYPQAHWAELAAQVRRAVSLPVVYTGRVTGPRAAEEVVARGHADLVGMARAIITDPEIVAKAKEGRVHEIRPCIGCNECIHRRLVDKLPFACAVNPHASREVDGPPPPARTPRRVLVVGGGPAGMELAGLLAERGHPVTLWEREAELGGQMRVAARATENAAYRDFVIWQEDRLRRAGVRVEFGRNATARDVMEFGADVVAVATGAQPRTLPIPGADAPFVVDGRDVMTGTARVGGRVAVIAAEDHMQPLTIAGFLADRGHRVHLVYQTPGPAPLVGKYTIGAPLARLTAAGAEFTFMSRVVRIERGRLETRNVYSDVPGEVTGVDSVVMAAGGLPDDGLYHELKRAGHPDVHLLGDAYAPRRITFATQQAHALAALV